jgi:hypothetical protein
MKVAVLKMVTDSIKDEEIKKHFYASLEGLKKEGVQVDFVEFGRDLLESLYATYIVISCAEATSTTPTLMGLSSVRIKVARPIRKSCTTPGRRASANSSNAAS